MGLLEDENVMIIHVIRDQVNGHSFQRLVVSPKLLDNVRIMAVEGAQEEHDKKKRRNDNLAPCHFQNQTVELGSKSHNWLVIALELVEDQEQEQGGKGVGNKVGATEGIQCGKHLETATIVDVALVLEEEMEGPILDSQTELTIPDATSLKVRGGCD
jgi:hypothetical protein